MFNLPSFQKLHSAVSQMVCVTQNSGVVKKHHEIGLLGIEICIVHMCF